MVRALATIAAATVLLVACAPRAQHNLPNSQLDNLIGNAIGDPSTCVLIADGRTGQVVYRYGDAFNCERPLPSCGPQGLMNAHAAMQFAGQPGGRMAYCASSPDGSRNVGWAEGRVQSSKRDLIFSAVMEGQRALPGHEINARLYDAFQKAGL